MNTPFENAWLLLKMPWHAYGQGESDETGRPYYPSGQDKITDDAKRRKMEAIIRNNPDWIRQNVGVDNLLDDQKALFESLHGDKVSQEVVGVMQNPAGADNPDLFDEEDEQNKPVKVV